MKGLGKLSEREIAHGTLEEMIKTFRRTEPGLRRNLILVKDSMEFRPAEIEGLAQQLGVDRNMKTGPIFPEDRDLTRS
jgi:hypothetical protein